MFTRTVLAISIMTQAVYQLPPPAEKAMQARLHDFIDATLREDFAAVVGMTDVRFVLGVGGPKKLIEITRRATEQMKEKMSMGGGQIVSVTPGGVRACARLMGEIQCTVAFTMIVGRNGREATIESEYLAFSADDGKRWEFLTGGQKPELVRGRLHWLSPDLPLREAVTTPSAAIQ